MPFNEIYEYVIYLQERTMTSVIREIKGARGYTKWKTIHTNFENERNRLEH